MPEKSKSMPLNVVCGLFRGATRRVMTGKNGNKNFYKGTDYAQCSLYIH